MPTNRRPSSNGQPSVRRPKVAGLRKREKTESPQTGANNTEERTEATVATEEPEATSAATADTTTTSAESTESAADGADASVAEKSDSEESGESKSTEAEATRRAATEKADEPAVAEKADESGAAEPEVAEEKSEDGGRGPSARVWWGASAVLLVVAVVCAVMAYLTYFQGPMSNQAMISAGETSEVKGQVEDGVQKLFSYDFNDTKKTEDAAKNILVGPAVAKYNDLFAVVKQQAPQQQLIVTTTVKSSAVTQLQGDQAQVLLFVDQHALRSSTGESNVGPAQLSVTAEKQGDQWKITNLNVR